MNAYTAALKAYAEGKKQDDAAAELGLQQGTLSRYLAGRLPTREIAERIDSRSAGKVPLALWQLAMAGKLGIAA
jgi:predicted transcriptional regulator